jgi:hypothetical protein
VIEIVPATMEHARAIQLRHGDACEVAAYGITKELAIADSMKRSLWSETYLVDGEVAAILGLGLTSMIGGHGVPWLLTGPACERHRRRFMIESKRQVGRMLDQVSPLVNFVHADYSRAIRWLSWLGFDIAEPQRGFRRIFMEAR